MPRPLLRILKAATFVAGCLLAVQAGTQVSLPLPAEIDATGSAHGAVKDEPTANDTARKAAEAKVEANYAAAMKRCDPLKDARKSACTAQAEAERTKGMADIDASLRAVPKGQPPTKSTP
ncbi:hypothetical protein ABL840_19340 [Variovorax sp. NFACC27]|uniref:hypothetical protein n=1 Tax=Variovorax sp. NFACC27 TaxID=1566274 RepID=UPI00089AE7A6|nr:hypothetical protein SAMN03159371_07633 [Variovorax sp. NFACC28]SEG99347.1 hypothetical protein SAMN03159365_07595 [Variovorax sp. NFACC29]SFE22199.1 hypothetical protein SAMN03159379_07581 [Variovorax sp. NFACC26]SFH27257.1 hypothetical protein SAMN03159447_07597 [Variovorax sp. NFACC27]